MASWTDGAAYAPIERPDGFATPEVAPLEAAPTEAANTPGPLPMPEDFAPTGPTTPLEHVRTTTTPGRNPVEPFLVSGGLLTAASSMGHDGARDPRVPFAVASSAAATGPPDLPPPTGEPLPPPVGQPWGPPIPFPAPPQGAPRALSPQEQSTQRTLVFLAVACCVIGFAIPAVGPWMLFFAGLLTWRTVPLTGKAGNAAMGVGLTLLVLGGLLEPSGAAILSRLATLIFGSVFVWLAVRPTRPRR